jgi:hypothetical protein
MDFTSQFDSLFQGDANYVETDTDLFKKLQDTRHALQESMSENDQLVQILNQLYSEAMVENVAVTELLKEIKRPLFNNIPLPRNADGLPMSERAGYVLYCMKFLGFATRKSTEQYHVTKEHLEGMHKSVRSNTAEVKITRTGSIKIPELAGEKEMKRNSKTAAPPSPPATPPKQNVSNKSKPV